MRRWWIGAVWMCAAVLGAGAAQACMICGTSLSCAWSPAGARWCIAGDALCVMGGACGSRGVSEVPGDVLEMIQVTLLEDGPGIAPSAVTPARLVRGAGPVAAGRHALRIARGTGAGASYASDAAIVFSGCGYAGGGTAVFRAGAGDGFTLSREPDGRGAHVRVCALAGRGPGRVLADERVGEEDAVVVRVPFDARTRVLVIQAPTLPRAEAEARARETQRAIHEAGAGRPEPMQPPFELGVLDR